MYSGKYSALYDYLNPQRQNESITLAFTDIEEILKFKLPNSAYKYSAWWSNENDGNHTQARFWLQAGWKTSNVEVGNKVMFIKVSG